jgi:hypothetical protein
MLVLWIVLAFVVGALVALVVGAVVIVRANDDDAEPDPLGSSVDDGQEHSW